MISGIQRVSQHRPGIIRLDVCSGYVLFKEDGSGNLANGSRWRNGFAIEAVRGALDLGWRELRLAKIYAGRHPDNHPSKHILERLGFTFVEGVFY